MVLYKYQKIRLDLLLLLMLFLLLFLWLLFLESRCLDGTGIPSDLSLPPLDGHGEVAPRSKSSNNNRKKQKIRAAEDPKVSPDVDEDDEDIMIARNCTQSRLS
jgi:hypothetical protein